MGKGDDVPLWKVVTVVLVFAVCNISLNFFNSWAVREGGDMNGTMGDHATAHIPGLGGGGFAASFFYTMFHMVATCLAALVLMVTCTKPEDGGLPTFSQLWAYRWQLFPIGILTVFNTGFNNWSLRRVTLFVNQVIKIIGPVPTAILEWLIAGKTYNLKVYGSVVVLTVGCIMSMLHLMNQDHGRQPYIDGIALCLISLLAASLKPVLQKLLMSSKSDASEALPPLTPEQILFWDSFIAFWGMLGFALARNEQQVIYSFFSDEQGNPNGHWLGLGIISFGSFVAFMFNLSVYYFILYTSALTSTIGSNGVKIFLLLLSAIQATMQGSMGIGPVLIIGNLIVVGSIVSYGYFGYQFKKEQAEKADGEKITPADEKTPLAKP